MNLLETLLRFFAVYGYYFLFLATALENIPVVGIFLPGEVIVVAAGFFASSGEFDLTAVILVACSGALAGTVASYVLGYRGGRALIEIIAIRLKVDGDRLQDADRYFSTHGPVTVFIGRYLTGVKAFIPALAGAHKMEFGRFVAFATLGIASWTVLAGALGFFFGRNWVLLINIIKGAGWFILAVILLLIFIIRYRKRGNEREL